MIEYLFTTAMMSVDIMNFSLIMYPLGEVRILTHIFKNFEKYVAKVKIECGCDDATASFVTLRECILLHQELIRYVDNYNMVLSNVTLFDYLQSSLELATIILQIHGGNSILMGSIFVATVGFCVTTRLFIFYFYGDQLTCESSDIAQAVFESNWYDQTKEVKQMICIVLVRCHKEVALFVGPFDKMSLRVFLSVIKATYSFVATMHTLPF
ncbi:unnamed protein product [Psylliodes chrysocephalus]|uniref:Uncharacterized protein n=1 Tax=Psylliodes chrysocephalus TaxID=3402493 RepID=A0A9P0GBN6_9CUCU|nr:unnamed protein product [Psylliodes chrysocephala]